MTGLAACGKPAEKNTAQGPVYAPAPAQNGQTVWRFAVHPLHNPGKLISSYQPLIAHLNASIPEARFALETSRDYQDYERKIRTGTLGFLLPNPWQTLEAMKVGYEVIAMAGVPGDFKGVIVVRKDSRLKEVGDLRGLAVSYPAPTAVAACLLPQWFFHEKGLDVNRGIVNRYVGSQESSIMSVYLGESAAGCTWPPPWRAFQREHPEEASQLRVIWETPSLVNNSVMVHKSVPPAVRQQLRRLLVELDRTPAGRAILAGIETERFLPASDADYEPVRRFVTRFEAEVRPVEKKP